MVGHALPGGPWSEYMIQGQSRQIDLYVSHDDTPKPVVILLQGSGCSPLFTINGDDGTYHPTSLFQDLIPVESRRVHFAMIEKPGVQPMKFAAGMSKAEKEWQFESAALRCTRDFVDHETKTARVDDVRTVMTALARQPWVTGFILAGHSEGTHVATGILETRPAERILAAGLFASAGSSSFWSDYVVAGSGSRAEFERALNRLRMLQKADDDFMFMGHPARRWKTYTLESTALDDVRESTVPLFVVQGTRDGTILAADLFVLEAVRHQPGRPVRYVVVDDGDHAFDTTDGRSHVGELFTNLLDWALAPHQDTGMIVVH